MGGVSAPLPPMSAEDGTVLQVEHLVKHFELKKGYFSFRRAAAIVHAVEDVTFALKNGEILGLVGESGCGKTTTGRLVTRLETPTSGRILFMGRDIASLKEWELKAFRKNIQMIFQDPYESLNPRFTVLKAVSEPLVVQGLVPDFDERRERVIHALEDAGLRPAEDIIERFPHELSGGQRQRVAIARALVVEPKCIVADEPVSMLDVSIRAGVMNLMLDLRDKYQIPYVFITHDIAVARYMADRIGVMYLGKLVEEGETDKVIFNPTHPYTRALIAAVPVPEPDFEYKPVPITGELPSPINPPSGCRFRTRCIYATELCKEQEPPYLEVEPGHRVLCHYAEDIFTGRLTPPPMPASSLGASPAGGS